MFGADRLATTEHTSRPWRIHEFTKDFRVLDVWALPTPGGPDDFPQLLQLWSTFDPGQSSPVLRALFAARWSIGRALGLDRPQTGFGGRVHPLRDRLTADLRDHTVDNVSEDYPFVPLYRTADEFAMEIANQTVHGVLHVGWVADATGGHRGQMAVLVRPNGVLGNLYLTAIAPFRHLVVYPLMMRDIGRVWREQQRATRQSGHR
jgi:Protein of unknown function (DUF2867)